MSLPETFRLPWLGLPAVPSICMHLLQCRYGAKMYVPGKVLEWTIAFSPLNNCTLLMQVGGEVVRLIEADWQLLTETVQSVLNGFCNTRWPFLYLLEEHHDITAYIL